MRPGAQFSRDEFKKTGGYSHKDVDSKYLQQDHYVYTAPNPNDDVRPKGARVTVEKPYTYYDMTSPHGHTQRDDNDNPVLFNATHGPGVISMLDSSPEHRAQAMTLLGVAALHHKNRYGAMPESDDSLSAQAAPMVKRLSQRGLVEPPDGNRQVEANNDVVRDEGRLGADLIMSRPHSADQIIPEHLVDAGRRTLREALKKPKTGSPQAGFKTRYEQSTLPLA